jgi:hypothetical protein
MTMAASPTGPREQYAGDGGERSLLDARLAHIQEGSDFPALSRQIIDTISLIDDDGSSLQRLANVVLREYSLTLSVVRTANTVHYRRTGRPIQSATHAMMMLGASTVRHLASSLLLFENYSKRSPYLHYGIVDAHNDLAHYVDVPLPGPRLPHDMAFTRNYAILNDFPLFWEPELLERDLHVPRLQRCRGLHAGLRAAPRSVCEFVQTARGIPRRKHEL